LSNDESYGEEQIKKFTFFSSYYNGIKRLPPEQQLGAYNEIFEFMFHDAPPTTPSIAFSFIEHHLISSKEKIRGGEKGGKIKKQGTLQENEKVPCLKSVSNKNKNKKENKNKEIEEEKEIIPEGIKRVSFKKPTQKEIQDYLEERNFTREGEADKIFDYYESKGWKVGSAAMKDWKATVRNWIRRAESDKEETFEDTRKPSDFSFLNGKSRTTYL